MNKRLLSVIFIFLIAFYGCDNDSPIQSDNTTDNGNVTIAIPKDGIPSYVATIQAVLSRSGFEPIIKSVDVFDGPSADIYFDAIVAGLWHLKVTAYNSENVALYEGETDVQVNPGQETPVNLTLSATTGTIKLTVTWDDGQLTGWHLSEENPVLTNNEVGNLFATGVRYPTVYKVGNQWRMLFCTSYEQYFSKTYCAISDDGENWALESTTPVLPMDGQSWDGLSTSAATVVKYNGVWYMYYLAIHGAYNPWMMGVATSTDGKNWTKHPDPIMTGEGWYYAFSPRSAIVKDGKIYLYFTGMDSNWHNKKFGLMVSDNGTLFTMHENSPILYKTLGWEGNGIDSPYVIENGDGYEMYYTSVKDEENHFGYATSSDGVNWTKNSNPILEHNDVVLYDNDERALYSSVYKENGITYLYYTVFQKNETFADYIALIKNYH